MQKTEAELVKSFQEEIYSLGLNWNVLHILDKVKDRSGNLVCMIEVFDYDNEEQKTVEVEFSESSIEFEY